MTSIKNFEKKQHDNLLIQGCCNNSNEIKVDRRKNILQHLIVTIVAALLLLPVQLFAYTPGGSAERNTGTIAGTIVDEMGLGVPSALLVLDKDNRYTLSELTGRYRFLDVPVGEYVLSVKYLGYEEFTAPVQVIAGKETVLNIQLKEEVYTIGEVIIVGEAIKGQARALSIEKNNSNITNMVAADHIGRFPDSNVGDALKRIPGITMQADQGEARNIVVRGLSAALNSVTLNGGRIPSAEGDNRNVQMDLIPSDMISTIEVNKTLLPDMEADAIGGSVNLVTKAAPKKRVLSANLASGYNPIRQGMTYVGGLVYGDRYFNDRLGAVLSLSYQDKDYGSDNIEAEWAKDEFDNAYIKQFEIRKYDVQRVRRSGSLNLDYVFNPEHKIEFNTMYNWRDDRENRYRHRQRRMKPIYDSIDNSIIGYKGELDRQTKGGIDNNRNRSRRLEDQRVLSVGMSGEHLLAPWLEARWSGSFARASEDRPNERYISYRSKNHNFTQDLSDGVFPKISTLNETDDGYYFDEVAEERRYTYEDEYTAKLHFRAPLSVIKDQKGRLRFGTKLRFKEKVRDNNYFAYEFLGDANQYLFNAIPTSYYDDERFLGGRGYIPGRFANNEFLGQIPLSDTSLYKPEDVLAEYYAGNYNAREDIYAAFVRWDQNITKDFVIITGVRMEHTKIDYLGHTLIDDTKGEDVRDRNSYTNWFPNLTFRYQPTQKFTLRGAFSTSIARPNYYWLVPYTLINSDDEEISTGNAHLKSTYAYNYDLIASYYPAGISQISCGFFYKRLNNFIYKYATEAYSRNHFAQDFPELTNPIADSVTWRYSQYRNGDNVDLYGLEVSYTHKLEFLPWILRNLVVNANYTYTHSIANGITNEDGEVREDMPLPGTAPHTINASLAYEDKLVSVRVSFNFTNDYLDELGGSSFEDRYYGTQSFLDVNASVNLPKGIQIYAQANNLLNQPLYYYQGQSDRLMQIEYYLPSFILGLKWNF